MNAYAYYAAKVLVSAVLIVAVSEAAKRSSLLGAVLASIPTISILAFVWLYLDTGSPEKVSSLSIGIFWLVLPSLLLFLLLPGLLRLGWSFWPSLLASIAATSAAYLLMLRLLRYFGAPLQ
jgi:hypothetical protein